MHRSDGFGSIHDNVRVKLIKKGEVVIWKESQEREESVGV